MTKAKAASTRSRARNGEGSTYQVGGRWRGTVAWTDPHGRPHRRYVSGRTQAEAQQKLTAIRAAIHTGDAPDRKAGSRTVGAWLDAWLDGRKADPDLRASTWLSYEKHVRLHLKPVLGRVVLTQLKPSQVKALTDRLRTEGKGPTAVKVRVTLRIALNAALSDGLVVRNAAALAKAPKVEQTGGTTLQPDQAAALIAGTEADACGPLIAFLLASGLRVGEALALRSADVDPEAGTLRVAGTLTRDHEREWYVSEPKTAESRRSHRLNPHELAALKRQQLRVGALKAIAGERWVTSHGSLVFPNEHGGLMEPSVVTRALTKACARLGLPHIRVHDLRHTGSSLLIDAGLPFTAVADWLGHTDVTMVMRRYASVLDGQRDAVANAMDRALGAG